MGEIYRFVRNAAGRMVPTKVNGRRTVPFKGVHAYRPEGKKAAPPVRSSADYPMDGNKVVTDLRTALELCGLRSGMTISTHHHFRDGDLLSQKIFDTAKEMGVRDLMWFPSAAFPCHQTLIEHLDGGVIHHIEASLNGPLGAYASQGRMRGLGVLRSHGGRHRAVQDGDVHIDIAVIAAPSADMFGNANGVNGPSACGPLGYALVDAQYADRVVVVTDNLVPFPCVPWHIMGSYVDHVVVVDKIGDPGRIVTGTTALTRSPDRLLIAELAAKFVKGAGLMRDGFSFQAGAGGTSLAFCKYMGDMMRQEGTKARVMAGGTTEHLVRLLEDGSGAYIFDGQAFDLEAVRSMRENREHLPIAPFDYYNYHSKGFTSQLIDVMVLGATEIDLDFNANVVTHSDGKLLHGIGGFQNCLFSKCTMIAVPSFRDRVPIIVDKVTTLIGPGELIDVVVTERGIAVNPLRKDLIEAAEGKGLPLSSLEEIKTEVEEICGGPPDRPEMTKTPVAVVEWVDGTLLDTVWKTAE